MYLDRRDIPANADCRGGVFATRRFPRPCFPLRADGEGSCGDIPDGAGGVCSAAAHHIA